MNILAIDTTTKKASVALKTDNKIIINNIDNEITHSEKLLPLIEKTLNEANVKLKDIQKIACTIGPGSFTGVRIAIATVKAIAKVFSQDIIGVTSMELIARKTYKNGILPTEYILAIMNAKNNRVYYNLYKNTNNILVDTKISGNLLIDDVINILKQKNIKDVTICLDDIETFRTIITTSFPHSNLIQAPLDISEIFNIDYENSNYHYDYLNLDAMYYRKSEAERTKCGE